MNEILGFSLYGKIAYTNGNFIKINKGFLFTIEPEIKMYSINPYCTNILFIDNNNILLGQDYEESLALKISRDLSTGETHEGKYFNNPCLIKLI